MAKANVKPGSEYFGKKEPGEKMFYTFYPHFHSFTEELTKRLKVPSISEAAGVSHLQSADTVYVDHVMLLRNHRQETTTLHKWAPVKLSDGRYAALPYGTCVRFENSDPTDPAQRLSDDFLDTQTAGTKLILVDSMSAWLIDFSLEMKGPAGDTLNMFMVPSDSTVTLLEWELRPELYEPIFSWSNYKPTDLVLPPYPVRELAFEPIGPGSAYSVYNWELFYHIPLAIAIQLSKNQRFEESKKWFQYIFNPEDDSDGTTPERFWKVKPLQTNDIKSIEDILINLSTNDDSELRKNTIECIRKWMEKPFRPHLVARFRNTAYMYKAVMAYLDNLIAWGDSLFRQDRPESVDDAADRYVEAMGILGYRPQIVPRKGSVGPSTYARLKQYANTRGGELGREFDAFSNILVELESDIPFADVLPEGSVNSSGVKVLQGIGREALYFCIPHNDKLVAYWDTVADRLYKIHNSLNIMGVFRELPLFEPPIDPGLLAKGVAAGLDVSAIAAGLGQPLPQVRFQFLFQKASEICQEAKSLGDKLLSVIEKEDNEALSILRAQHESTILEITEMVKYSQWQEAVKSIEGLEKSYENALHRFVYYERLLGEKEGDIKTPSLRELESPKSGLEKLKFKSSEPAILPRAVDVDISEDAGGATGGKIKTLSSYEVEELKKLSEAQTARDAAAILDAIAGILRLIPEIGANIMPFGMGADIKIGGAAFAGALQIYSGIFRGVADRFSHEGNLAAKLGGYARREQEWTTQRNAAAGEINQIIKQYVAAQIREAIAEREWKNHKKQMENAKRIEEFLTNEKTGKKANQAFYSWMKREVKGLYGQCFRFALEVAQKAERALQHELGDRNLSFLKPTYLTGKEELLAGEKLQADLRKMEMAYHETTPDPPMVIDISLLQVNPTALLQLRATGRCSFSVPEELFDLNCPGYYFRRIHSAAVSIPCVSGPYTGVNCTLTLVKSTIRKSSLVGDGYKRAESDNDRFEDNYDLESIVISKGQNDSGRLQADRSARDESQRQPFMGKGVISDWQLELPADPSKKDPTLFDYDTISDVVLHLQYTARQGGRLLKGKAMQNLKTAIEEARMAGSVRLFSLRHEFPVEWNKFKNAIAENGGFKLEMKLEERHYPYWSKGRLESVKRIELFAKGIGSSATSIEIFKEPNDTDNIGILEKKDASLGGIFSAKLDDETAKSFVPASQALRFYFDDHSMSDLWVAVTWGNG